MSKYSVPCSWIMSGCLEVEAKDKEEAIQKAMDCGQLPEGEYIDSSFDVAEESIEEISNAQ